MVVTTLECPRWFWKVRMSIPPWRRWVAKEWRMQCDVAGFGMAAFLTAFLN